MLLSELYNEEHWKNTYDKISLKGSEYGFDLGNLMLLAETESSRHEIITQLLSGTYQWSIPEKLLLAKAGTTKKRTVYMYTHRDRFVLGVLYRALSATYDKDLMPNCFSYRTGVSTSTAITYIQKMKNSKPMYGLKLDISAYFNSVSRSHLENTLNSLFGTDSGLRQTMNQLFMTDTVRYKGEVISEYKSLIAGCALGSFFANYCLRELDQYFHDRGIVYARYSDDLIFLCEEKEDIEVHLAFVKEKLKEYGLSINEKKYEHFKPHDPVEYLGLSLSDRGIDISEHAKRKIKKTIKRWIKAGRKEIEMKDVPFDRVARRIVNRLNWKFYKSYVHDKSKFGWGYYAFRYITILDSLTEIDFYLRDQLRYLKTGKHNKANVKALSDDDFQRLGVLSLYDMYQLFHEDFDYYCEVAYLV